MIGLIISNIKSYNYYVAYMDNSSSQYSKKTHLVWRSMKFTISMVVFLRLDETFLLHSLPKNKAY